jgi:hypothetical protein
MILLECFAEAHIDNIAACLRLNPQEMILIGDAVDMEYPLARYKELLAFRNQSTRIIPFDIRKKSFSALCQALYQLLSEDNQYVIDLTGGDALVIMAVGAVLSRLEPAKRRCIQVEKYDHDLNVVRDCIHDHQIICKNEVQLSVEEMILLHGGILHRGAYQPPQHHRARDIDGLWQIASQQPKDWNQRIGLLNELEKGCLAQQEIHKSTSALCDTMKNFQEKEPVLRALLQELDRRGVIQDRSDRHHFRYRYHSSLLHQCTTKAGNILEIKTLLEGRQVTEDGVPYFTDSQMSATIDWDGHIHKISEHVPDTRNEIDAIFIKGTTPLFVSCKNGHISEDELYKLNTVAQYFGGPYAKKMLIATDLDQKSPRADRAFTQRAWDMDIFLVSDAGQLTEDEWQQLFDQAMQ